MPTLEELDTLKAQVNQLGDEPRLLAERGETLQDIAPPDSPVDTDLEMLLSDDDSGGGIDEMEALLGSYSDDLSLDDLEPLTDDSDTDFSIDDLLAEDAVDDAEAPDEIDDVLDFDDIDDVAGLDEIVEADEVVDIDNLADLSDLAEISDLDEIDEIVNIDDIAGADDISDIDSIDDIAGMDDIADPSPDEEIQDLAESDFGDMDFGDLDDIAPTGELPPDDFSLDDLDLGEAEDSELPEITDEDIGADDFSLDDISTDTDLPDLDDLASEVTEEDFSLEDLDDVESVSDDDFSPGEGGPEDGISDDLGDLGDLEDLDDLGDLGDLDELDESADDIPDVESAVEGLGDLDSMEVDSEDELSLDEELNFDEELGTDVLSDIRDVGDESLQFSMDDFGEQYNFKEGDGAYTENLGVDLEELEQSLDDAAEGEARPFSINDDDFNALRRTLASLPRNLKIALEELLADERRKPEDLKPLIEALIEGESPKALVARFKAITKRKIELPKTYEKRSGQVLVERQESLVYKLVREGWPVIRTILLVISLAWVFGVAVFMWVYRPLKAESLYAKGLDAVAADDLEDASMYFYDAWDGWPLFYSEEDGTDRIADSPIVVKGWKNNARWLDYARALRRRKHWDAAEQFYNGYLRVKPDSKAVRLELSSFLSGVLGKYEEAVAILEDAPLPAGRTLDRDYVLSAGDVFLDWAEDDPTKYDEARKRYAKILEVSRNDERAFLSMMRYHLRLRDDTEIDRLLPIFDNEVSGKTDEPVLAAEVYAGLGEYKLARGDADEARRFINLALGADPTAPEPSYVDSLFWRLAGNDQRELQAYKRTLVNLENRESLSRNDLKMRILTLGGMGRIQAARSFSLADDPRQATEARSLATVNYSKAVDLYEDARMRNQLGASPEYGRLYLELGDLMYEGRQSGADLQLTLGPLKRENLTDGSERYTELVQAENSYNEAQELYKRGVGSPDLPPAALYRRGYARYVLGIDDALLDFHRVARVEPDDYEVRLALAAVLLNSGDYEAARSQYSRAIVLLDEELRGTGGILSPFERQSHEELLLRYVLAWNNLGVSRARSAARGGGENDYAAALSAFTMASEYLDEVFNDMTDLNRRGAVGLRDLEERRIVSQEEGRNLLKEKATFPYINRLRLLGLDRAVDGEDTYLLYPDIPSDLN